MGPPEHVRDFQCVNATREIKPPPKTDSVLLPAWYPALLCIFDQKEPSFTVPVQTPVRGSRPVCCPQRLCCLKHLWSLRFRSQWGREAEPWADRSRGPLPSFIWLHPGARRRLEIAQKAQALLFVVFSSYNFLRRATNQQRKFRTISRNKGQHEKVTNHNVAEHINVWFSCRRWVK